MAKGWDLMYHLEHSFLLTIHHPSMWENGWHFSLMALPAWQLKCPVEAILLGTILGAWHRQGYA
jgi:hypothetical protein